MSPLKINPATAAACLQANICPRCTLRVANVRTQSSYELPTPTIIHTHGLHTPPPTAIPSNPHSCPTCLGILHDTALDRIAAAVAPHLKKVQHNGHFKINASIPVSASVVRDRAMRIFLERNHVPTYPAGGGGSKRPRGSHPSANGNGRGGVVSSDSALHVSLREAVKWAACSRIQQHLGIRYSSDAELFLDISFTHPESDRDSAFAATRASSHPTSRKRSASNLNGSNGPESTTHVAKVMGSMSTDQFVDAVSEAFIPPSSVTDPASVTATVSTASILFAGNYNKYSRIVSQTPWFVDRPVNGAKRSGLASVVEDDQETDEHGRKKRTATSVEDVVVKGIMEVLRPEKATFTAGGREDVDVRMLGEGRPFVVELTNPSVVESRISDSMLASIREISAKECSSITVNNLRIVPKDYFTQMRMYESEKRKCYRCVVWTSKDCSMAELRGALEVTGGFMLKQKTPLRVLHRRTQAVRERQIFEAKVSRVVSANFFVLDIIAAAGTYIKEFVHGDNGRTQPNVAQLLGCDADILQLDVSKINTGLSDGL